MLTNWLDWLAGALGIHLSPKSCVIVTGPQPCQLLHIGSGDISSVPRASIAGILPTELSPSCRCPCLIFYASSLAVVAWKTPPAPLYLPGDYTSLSRHELGFPLSRDPLAPLLVPHNPIRTRTGSLGRSNPTGPQCVSCELKDTRIHRHMIICLRSSWLAMPTQRAQTVIVLIFLGPKPLAQRLAHRSCSVKWTSE